MPSLTLTSSSTCRQCSECDKDSDQSDREAVDPEAPRKLRHKDNGNGDSSSDQASFFLGRKYA